MCKIDLKLRHILLLSALTAPVLHGQIIALGGNINLQASLTELYDSNLVGAQSGQGGMLTTLSPSANYKRDTSLITTSAGVGMGVNRSFTDREFNSENYHANTAFQLEKGTLGEYSLSLNANYSEGTAANFDVGRRISSKSYALSLTASMDTSERTGLDYTSSMSWGNTATYGVQNVFLNGLDFHVGPFWQDTTFFANISNTQTKSSGKNELGAGLDQSSNSLSLGIGKRLREKLMARVNAGYLWYDNANSDATQNAPSDGSLFFSGNINGPFLPESWVAKTSSSFSLGYTQNTTRGLYEASGKSISGSVNINWRARENTNISLSASRSRQLQVNDRASETTSVALSASQEFVNGIHVGASLGYMWSTFFGPGGGSREGLTRQLSVSKSFTRDQHWSASLVGQYSSVQTIMAARQLDHYTLSASLNYSY